MEGKVNIVAFLRPQKIICLIESAFIDWYLCKKQYPMLKIGFVSSSLINIYRIKINKCKFYVKELQIIQKRKNYWFWSKLRFERKKNRIKNENKNKNDQTKKIFNKNIIIISLCNITLYIYLTNVNFCSICYIYFMLLCNKIRQYSFFP